MGIATGLTIEDFEELPDCLARNHELVDGELVRMSGNAPDISFVRRENAALLEADRRIQRMVPDLAIEIVSQDDTFHALMAKAKRYRQAGTREVWIFDLHTRQTLSYTDRKSLALEDDAVFATGLIPGFTVKIGDLFDRIDL